MAKARILIVAQEAPAAQDIRTRLEGMGYSVCGVAATGSEALSLARGDRPDVVLMDLQPNRPGDVVAAADQVRRELDMPVVCIAAPADDPTPAQGPAGEKGSGAFSAAEKAPDPFSPGPLTRPFQDRELYAAVEMSLYKHGMARELRSRKQWLATILGSIADAVVSVSPDGTVAFMNPLAETLTGWRQAQAVGRPLAEVFVIQDERTGQPQAERIVQALQHGKAGLQGGDVLLVARDGTARPVSCTAAPIRHETGEIRGGVLVFHDVTERRRAERRVRELEKTETIGRLAGGVAHHFNNLLTIIMGNAQLLKNDPLAVLDLGESVEQILDASRQAAQLTGHLLSFSRVGSRQLAPVAIHEAIRTVADMLGKTTDRRVRVEQDLQAQPDAVMGDASQIQNALMNLGLNACDAMPGGGTLTFATRIVTLDEDDCSKVMHTIQPGQYIEITAADTGVPGAPGDPQTLERAVEPFFTTKETGRGTGMGLASVYACVQNHNGTTEVESHPGRGTRVRLLLPIPTGHQVAPGQQPQAVQDAHAPTQGHILVVDDEPGVAELCARMLRRRKYTVTTAVDGKQAVELYRKHPNQIDLVILDLVMPEMDGREAFVLMKEINPKVRALLSSGYGRNDMPRSILEEGVLGFLAKPYQMADLCRTVERYLHPSLGPPAAET